MHVMSVRICVPHLCPYLDPREFSKSSSCTQEGDEHPEEAMTVVHTVYHAS